MRCGSTRVLRDITPRDEAGRFIDPEDYPVETVHCELPYKHPGGSHRGVTQELATIHWTGAASRDIPPRQVAS